MSLTGQVIWEPASSADEKTLVEVLGDNYRDLGELLDWAIIVKSAPKPPIALGGFVRVRSKSRSTSCSSCDAAADTMPVQFSREVSDPYGYQGYAIRLPAVLLGQVLLGRNFSMVEAKNSKSNLLAVHHEVAVPPVLDFVLYADGTAWGEDRGGGLRTILERPKVVSQLLDELEGLPPERRDALLEEANGSKLPWRRWAASKILHAEDKEAEIKRLRNVENRWRKET